MCVCVCVCVWSSGRQTLARSLKQLLATMETLATKVGVPDSVACDFVDAKYYVESAPGSEGKDAHRIGVERPEVCLRFGRKDVVSIPYILQCALCACA